MAGPKLTYFDFDGGRGEAIRLALALGEVPFEDHRFPVSEWAERRDTTPFHAVPLLEIDGEIITQSNAILRWAGRQAGLYPDDLLDALRCDEVLDAVEDIITRTVQTFGIEDPEELRRKRSELVSGPLTLYLTGLQALFNAHGGRFFVGEHLGIADLKAFVWLRQLRSGVLDHVPQDLVQRVAPRLVELAERVSADPRVTAYYAAR